MRSGVEYFFATPSTKAEILALKQNVLRKNTYVQTKAILKINVTEAGAIFFKATSLFLTQWLH